MNHQDNRANPYVSIPIKYGLVGGLLSIILFFVLLALGFNPLINGSFFGFFFIPIFIFFALKEFKKHHSEDTLHFWQGMTLGFATYLLLALISAVFIWVYLAFFNHELLISYIESRVTLIQDSKEGLVEQLGEETYASSIRNIRLANEFDLALDDFLRKILAGFFITTIISVVMRQNKQSIHQ